VQRTNLGTTIGRALGLPLGKALSAGFAGFVSGNEAAGLARRFRAMGIGPRAAVDATDESDEGTADVAAPLQPPGSSTQLIDGSA